MEKECTPNGKKSTLLSSAVDTIYKAKYVNYDSPLHFSANLVNYNITGSKLVCNISSEMAAGGNYKTILKWLNDQGSSNIPAPPIPTLTIIKSSCELESSSRCQDVRQRHQLSNEYHNITTNKPTVWYSITFLLALQTKFIYSRHCGRNDGKTSLLQWNLQQVPQHFPYIPYKVHQVKTNTPLLTTTLSVSTLQMSSRAFTKASFRAILNSLPISPWQNLWW